MERIGTTPDGRLIIIISAEELEAGKYVTPNIGEDIRSTLNKALSDWEKTEIYKKTNDIILQRLFVKNILHSKFSSEEIETYLSTGWAYPKPQFEFDGTIASYRKFSDDLEMLPMIGPKKAAEIRRTIEGD